MLPQLFNQRFLRARARGAHGEAICVEVLVKATSIFIYLCLMGGASWCAHAEPTQTGSGLVTNAATITSRQSNGLVSIRQAFDAAWQRAVLRGEAEGTASRSKSEQELASNLLAGRPSVELSQRSDRWHQATGSRENEVGVALPIWWPGQRSARIASAQVGARFADAAKTSSRLRLAGEVREAAWALSAQRAELEVAEDQAAYLKQLSADVWRRVAAGDLARSDWLAAESESLGAASAALDAQTRLRVAASRWKLLTGLDDLPDPRETAPPAGDATAQHPDAALALFAQDRAMRQLDLAANSKWDSPELAVKFREDTPASGIPALRSVGISIRIPLGASARGRTQLAEAQANRTVAELHFSREQDRLREEAMTATFALDIAQRSLTAERERARHLSERAILIEKSFKLGESPLTDLLRAKSAATQAAAGSAKQEAAAGLASARQKQANGELP